MEQFSKNFWNETDVLVTGGASFIGSHLVDRLVSLVAHVSVADDLSTGKMDNLEQSKDKIKFIKTDLEYNSKSEARNIFKDNEIVFHLAADHGGRGYISSHPADVCSSFAVDHHVFEACSDTNVEKVIFASSACVYPTDLQKQLFQHLYRSMPQIHDDQPQSLSIHLQDALKCTLCHRDLPLDEKQFHCL